MSGTGFSRWSSRKQWHRLKPVPLLSALWDMLGVGGVQLIELGLDDCPRMRELMWQDRNLLMGLANAAFVRIA